MPLTRARLDLLRLAGRAALLAGVAAALAAGRGSPRESGLSSRPDFVGWVTRLEPGESKGILGRIVVESQTEKIIRRLVVTVTTQSHIYRRQAGATREADFGEVALRDQAKLWLAGPVPRAFPAQVVARQVLVERLY